MNITKEEHLDQKLLALEMWTHHARNYCKLSVISRVRSSMKEIQQCVNQINKVLKEFDDV